MSRIIFLLLTAFLIGNLLYAEDTVVYNNSANKEIKGKVVEIRKDSVIILDKENGKKINLKLDKSFIEKIKIGESVIIKRKITKKFRPGCRCMSIRQRIKKLAEKRRQIKNIRRSFPNRNIHRHMGR